MEENKDNVNNVKVRDQWGTKIGFVLATAGSAIGLGNIWKFPYVAGIHGGGAFVITYLIAIILIGISVMIGEMVIGRSGQRNAVGAIQRLTSKKSGWQLLGFMGILAAFIILSYYSVIAGWIMNYVGLSIGGEITYDTNLTLFQNIEGIQGVLDTLLGNGGLQVILHFAFMIITVVVVMFGIKKGIEKVANILMPLLFVILIGLFIYVFTLPGNPRAWSFLFNLDFSTLTPTGLLEGLSHAFFTLSLGMAIVITYGSYLKRDASLVKSSFIIAGLDTVIALLAGVVIFSVVFSFGLDPGEGPALIFATLPSLFAQLPAGTIISTIFFVLVFVAAITSAISILEAVVAFFVDQFNANRKTATILVGVAAFLVGLLSALGYNELSSVVIPTEWIFGEDVQFLDLFDKIATNILLPLGGFFVAVFVGWRMNKETFDNEFKKGEYAIKSVVRVILKFIAPVLILIVFLYGLNFTGPLFEAIGISEGEKAKPAEINISVKGIEDEDEVWYMLFGNDDMHNEETGEYYITDNVIKFSVIGVKKVDNPYKMTMPAGIYDMAIVKMDDYGTPTLDEDVTPVDNAFAEDYVIKEDTKHVISVTSSDGYYTIEIREGEDIPQEK